jgi:hypothetical protein
MRRFVRFAAIFLFLTATSCISFGVRIRPSPFDGVVPADYVPVKAANPDVPRFEEFRKFVRQTLGFMHEPMAKAVTNVTLNDDGEHFKQVEGETGHCYNNGNICFYTLRLYRGGVFHEASHAYDVWLEYKGYDIHGPWKKAAGDVYGRDRYAPDTTFPQAGILTSYGATDEDEDRADWIKAIYCYLADLESPLKRIRDKSDSRYLQKLRLLRDFQYISEAAYNQILPLLEKEGDGD